MSTGYLQRHGGLLLAGATSVVLHASVGYWLLVSIPLATFGAGGNRDGIAMEAGDGSAIESVVDIVSLPAAAAEVSPKEGDDNPEEQAAVAAADTAPRKTTETAELMTNAPEGDVAASTEVRPETEQRDQVKADDGQGQDNARQTPRDALTSGGLTSRGLADIPPASASTGASPGEISRYASGVQAVIVRHHPRHDGRAGRVRILFVVGKSGEVESASIYTTSGNGQLDEKALSAIRRMRFPEPPSNFIKSQLTYLTVFNFH